VASATDSGSCGTRTSIVINPSYFEPPGRRMFVESLFRRNALQRGGNQIFLLLLVQSGKPVAGAPPPARPA